MYGGIYRTGVGKDKKNKTMLTRNAVIEIVKNYAKEIEQQGVHLRTVILYGSFAKGRQHEWSDIDVALVADEFTGLGFLDKKRFAGITVQKPYIRIEAKTYPTEYFHSGDPFINEIKKEGITIVDRME
ncbi:MAG: nucleotidyltransferase domain-containing protein [Dysgonamonadaceae bacterium]|jgi:predicted nucleotidyltransferase|nr:nucleotidyltransferase domain-containing protein [Dysgonamonadaceae bacterium]